MVVFWNGYPRLYLAGFVVPLIVMVTFLEKAPFFLVLRSVKNPEFHDLKRVDKGYWPRCLLWHGWLPHLSGVNGASPWAADDSEGAG